MAALRALLDAGGGVAIVSGEAGIGKSRLVREFAAEAAERGRVVLWGRPEEVAQPGPYALIVDLLESIAELGDDKTSTRARELGTRLGQNTPGEERPTPAARAVAAEIRGLSAQLPAPPLLVLEDLHWADEAAHAVMLHLCRAATDDRHLIVCTYRSESMDDSASLSRLIDSISRERGAKEVSVGPLSDADVASMIQAMGLDTLDSADQARIARLGEGIPFFVEELADAAITGGLPRSLELSVNARLRQLNTEALEVVKMSSLMVGAIDAQVVAHALELSIGSVSKHLVEAVALGLLSDREGKLVFRHSLVRDAVGRGIVSVQLREMHRQIASSVEKLYSSDLEFHSSALGRHYREAGDSESAGRFLILAGERALALAATDEARSNFSLALGLSRKHEPSAKRGLAEVALREGGEKEAATLFRQVADSLRESGDFAGAAYALGRLAWALRSMEQSEQVVRVLDEGLDLFARNESSLQHIELLVQKGQMLSFLFGRFLEAKPILERAILLAREADDNALVAQASDGLAQVADWEGDVEAAIGYGRDAVARAIASRSPEVVGRTHNNHAVKLASYGRTHEGREILSEGRAHLVRSYGAAGVGALDVSQAWIAWLMGLPEEVASLAALGHAAWQRWRGYRRILEVWAAVEQSQQQVAENRLAAAWNELGGRERVLANSDRRDYETRQVLFAESLLLAHFGDPTDALSLARAVVDIDRGSGSELFDFAQALVLLARALVRAERIPEALEVISEVTTLLEPVDRYPYLRSHIMELNGLVAFSSGDLEAARGFLVKAQESFLSCSNQSDRARCLREAAECLVADTRTGARDEAIDALKEARALSESSGASAEKNRVEALLRQLGVRARAGRPRKTEKGTLSPREAEVAVLVAAGVTNSDIATELFLSDRTVQDHISNALRKLGLTGRAALAAWAARQGLV